MTQFTVTLYFSDCHWTTDVELDYTASIREICSVACEIVGRVFSEVLDHSIIVRGE